MIKEEETQDFSWTSLREEIKEKGITEKQFYIWLVKADKGESEKEKLQLITNHVFHSIEEHLYAPPHLRGILPKGTIQNFV